MNEPNPAAVVRSRIPRIIWQTYSTRDLPPQAAVCRESWTSLNPEWEYRFLDNDGIDNFVKEHATAEVYGLFRRLPLDVMKADLWRYLATFVYGGLYADIDTVCLEPVDDWLPDEADFVVAPENEIHLCQWTYLSIPGHQCLRQVLNLITARTKGGIDTSSEHFVHHYTGPGVWTEAILQATGCVEKNMISLSRSGNPPCLQSLNIRVLGWRYFRDWKVRHLFGSLAWEDGYESWIRSRDVLLQGGD